MQSVLSFLFRKFFKKKYRSKLTNDVGSANSLESEIDARQCNLKKKL